MQDWDEGQVLQELRDKGCTSSFYIAPESTFRTIWKSNKAVNFSTVQRKTLYQWEQSKSGRSNQILVNRYGQTEPPYPKMLLRIKFRVELNKDSKALMESNFILQLLQIFLFLWNFGSEEEFSAASGKIYLIWDIYKQEKFHWDLKISEL